MHVKYRKKSDGTDVFIDYSDVEAICIYMTEGERKQIADMEPKDSNEERLYAIAPMGWGGMKTRDWMHGKGGNND